MLDYSDSRWPTFTAGYRVPIDLRPFLQALEQADDPAAAWHDLWQELYHQGDIGEGSCVAVPHLVRIHRQRAEPDWNTYALVCTIELARAVFFNPDVPGWMEAEYDQALRDLGQMAMTDLPRMKNAMEVRCVLSLLAVVHGARTCARVLAEFSEDELEELLESR